MRTIIAGTRRFTNYDILCKVMEGIEPPSAILSGGAKGADKLGERWAIENRVLLEIHPANWNRHGVSAGPIRNAQMATTADRLIAFWDGTSKGTKHMIDCARRKGLIVIVVNI